MNKYAQILCAVLFGVCLVWFLWSVYQIGATS
jgi:hypothetical protein